MEKGKGRNKMRKRLADSKVKKSSARGQFRIPGSGYGSDYLSVDNARAYNYIPGGTGTPVAGRGKPMFPGSRATETRAKVGPRDSREYTPTKAIDIGGTVKGTAWEETKTSKNVRSTPRGGLSRRKVNKR